MIFAPPRNAGPYRRGVASFIGALMLSASLAGCGPAETGLQADAARQLQARVLQVSEAAATNDRDGALKALDALDADLVAGADRGEISAERQRRISTVIAAVRADLAEIQISAQSSAVKPAEAEETSTVAESAQPQEHVPVAPEPAPVLPAPVAQPPVPAEPAPAPAAAPAPSDSNNGNAGNGNGNKGNEGKGKGRDN